MDSENSNTSNEFVDRTLARLKKTYRITLTVAILILAGEGIYLAVLNNMLTDRLTVVGDYVKLYRKDFDTAKDLMTKIPAKSKYADKLDLLNRGLDSVNKAGNAQGVAELISARIVNELDWQSDVIASNARDYLHEEMEQLPSRMQQLIPKYSGRMSHEVDNWISNYCTASSEEIGATFDIFLEQHSEEIRKFSEATDDEAALDRLDQELTLDLVKFMETTQLEKYGNLKDQSDRMLNRIKAANALIKPLATKDTEDLTPEELRLRRAVGLFMEGVQKMPTPSESTE